MMSPSPWSADGAWQNLLSEIMTYGLASAPRGRPIRELLATTAAIDMRRPIVTVRPRKLSYKFMAGEAWWIASGRDDVASIARYNKRMADFSDDGQTFFGAYGVKAKPQIDYVVEKLYEDQDSRQAVINIWRECPPSTKDVPCTTTIQWMIRGNRLHCIDTMRSNDIWLGFPYDVFNFSMLSACLLIRLRERGLRLQLGTLYMRAGSAHVYKTDWPKVEFVLMEWANGAENTIDYASFNPDDYAGESALIHHLWVTAERILHGFQTRDKFMSEF